MRSSPENEQNDGIQRIAMDLGSVCSVLPTCKHMLTTIPPPETESKELEQFYDEVVRELPPNSWIGMLSTTGVYGNYDGDWVTEESECRCEAGSKARRFLQCEESWRKRADRNRHRLCIFRCAGIYGPDASALHTVFQKGILRSQQDLSLDITNRIHVVDLSRAVIAAMLLNDGSPAATDSCRIYNLADDLPESRRCVMEYAVGLLEDFGVPVKTWTKADASEIASARARRRRLEKKRVSNQRMKEELVSSAPLLRYRTYREGLQSILQDRSNPWWKLPDV